VPTLAIYQNNQKMKKLYFPAYLPRVTFSDNLKLVTNMDDWEQEVKQALEKHPEDQSLIAYTLAINLAYHGNASERRKDIINYWKQVIKFADNDDYKSQAYLHMSYQYHRSNDFEEREKCLKKSLRFCPENEATLLELARLNKNDYMSNELAEPFYQKLSELPGRDKYNDREIGLFFCEIKQFKKALALLESILNDDTVDGRFNNMARLYLVKEEPEQALPFILDSLKLNPADTEAIYLHGLYYIKTGDYYRALHQNQKLLEIDPHYTEAHISNAACYYELDGNLHRAIDYLERISKDAKPKAREAYYKKLARMYDEIKDDEKSNYYLQKMLVVKLSDGKLDVEGNDFVVGEG
jgi:tetratricopeptide (TPR) repeat protein